MNQIAKQLFALTLLGSAFVTTQAQKLAVSDVEMASGQTSSFVVSLKESQPDTYNALSFSMLCPEGVSPFGEPLLTDLWDNPFCVTSNDMVLPVASAMEQYESVMFYAVGGMDQNHNVKMAFASATEIPVSEIDSLLVLSIATEANMSPDVYFIKMQNILFEYAPKGKDKANDASVRVRVYKLGDVDRNNAVNVADATDVINHILGEQSEAYNVMLADMNDDKVIDIFDVMKLLNVILYGRLPDTGTASSRLDEEMAESIVYEDMTLAYVQEGLTIGIPNAQRFTSFQFDLEMPDDVELTGVSLLGMTTNHMLQFVKTEDNIYRVVGLSMDNSLLEGNHDSALIGLAIPNCGKVTVSNAMFVTPQGAITYFNDQELEDGITGINSTVTHDSQAVYDLSGRKVADDSSHLHKGIYIINHKRVVVK